MAMQTNWFDSNPFLQISMLQSMTLLPATGGGCDALRYVKGILKSSSFPALRGDQVAAGLASGLLWNAGHQAARFFCGYLNLCF